MRVLVVEEEAMLAEAVQTGLRRECMAADVACDGEQARERLALHDYDVVVLDRDQPDAFSQDLCRQLAGNRPGCRILVLTGTQETTDVDVETHADDYLLKPFDFDELVARVLALGRRSVLARPPVLERFGIRVDPLRLEAYRDGRFLHLRRREFAVLTLLLQADGGTVGPEYLLEKAWGDEAAADPFADEVELTIEALREKLGPPRILHSSGLGFYLREAA